MLFVTVTIVMKLVLEFYKILFGVGFLFAVGVFLVVFGGGVFCFGFFVVTVFS